MTVPLTTGFHEMAGTLHEQGWQLVEVGFE